METNKIIQVRLLSYKSFRHYGGRDVTPSQHICKATLKRKQDGAQPFIVELLESCAGYDKGHVIAVPERNYDV